MQSVKVICDSISEADIRLPSLELRYPKFIHGELMTHRVFSRNASSSRAVPVAKLIFEARSDGLRAEPARWVMNEPGMQGYTELKGHELQQAKDTWRHAARKAADFAEYMAEVGAHKQIVNRLLEPFTHIRTLVTATDFDNFFGLRLDSGADPTMQALANEMWKALAKSRPVPLKFGQWHLPYVNQKDKAFLAEINNFIDDTDGDLEPIEYLKRISAARCARLSYKSNETGRTATVAEDLALYNRLMGAQPLHASPTEHQATPDVAATAHWVDEDGQTEDKIHWYHPHQHGNFRGWIQFRKQIPGEACAPLPEQFLPF